MTVSPGSLEVICGPMYSGKTEELLRRLYRSELARIPLQLFKPALDTRYGLHEVVTHTKQRRRAEIVAEPSDIPDMVHSKTQVVGMDEVQFFSPNIVQAVDDLLVRGVRVLVSGLDRDSNGVPFGSVPTLLAMADHVNKLAAVCFRCGSEHATRSYRLPGQSSSHILLGGKDSYEARCTRCYYEGIEIQEANSHE